VLNPKAASRSDILRFLGHKPLESSGFEVTGIGASFLQPSSPRSTRSAKHIQSMAVFSAGEWSSSSRSRRPATPAILERGMFCIAIFN